MLHSTITQLSICRVKLSYFASRKLSLCSNCFLTTAHGHLQFIPDKRFEVVKKFVKSGAFGPHNYDELIGSLEGNEGFGQADYFLVGKDFPSYIECQQEVDEAYKDQRVSCTTLFSIILEIYPLIFPMNI